MNKSGPVAGWPSPANPPAANLQAADRIRSLKLKWFLIGFFGWPLVQLALGLLLILGSSGRV